MRLFSLLCLSICVSYALQAQSPYLVSTTLDDTYAPLVNATPALGEDPWDDPNFTVPIGFDFTFFGHSTDTLYISGIFLGGSVALQPMDEPMTIISPYFSDIVDRGSFIGTSSSPILYKTEGEPGSRIFKMEWQNAGFYNELNLDGGIGTNYINFQLWLYESLPIIEFRYGDLEVEDDENLYDLHDGFTGPLIGFIADYDYDSETFDAVSFLSGVAAKPTLEVLNQTQAENLSMTLSDHPAIGTTYRFAEDISAIESPGDLPGLRIFPQPARDPLFLDLPASYLEYELQLFNSLGQEVLAKPSVFPGLQDLAIDQLPTGMYQLLITAEDRQFSHQIIIQ